MNGSGNGLVVGTGGASGCVGAVRMLEQLRELDVETHLFCGEADQ